MKPSKALFFIAAAASFQFTAVEAEEAFVAQVNSSRALALPAAPSAATMLAAPVNAGFVAPSAMAATKQNVSQLSQVGTNNSAMVAQIGAGNLSALSQQGHGNVAVVTQSNRSH